MLRVVDAVGPEVGSCAGEPTVIFVPFVDYHASFAVGQIIKESRSAVSY